MNFGRIFIIRRFLSLLTSPSSKRALSVKRATIVGCFWTSNSSSRRSIASSFSKGVSGMSSSVVAEPAGPNNSEKMALADTIFIDPAEYPLVRRDDSFVDNYHGTKVADPYRWLEDPDAEETKQFVSQLNAISEPFLEKSEIREKMTEQLRKLWNFEKYGCTAIHGDYYYYYHNSGLQNQWVYYQQTALNQPGKVFLDPNTFSDDGTTSISRQSWSDDGKILCYGVSEKGSDWTTLKFKKCTGEDLPDIVPGVKHSGVDWVSSNDGVFYSKYPEHKGAIEGSSTEKHSFHSLYFHKLGTDACADALVADFRENENFMIHGFVSQDGRYLIGDLTKGCDPVNRLYYFDLAAINNKVNGKLELKPLFDKFDAKYSFIDNDNDTALILTNHSAPMFKLVRVKLNGPCAGESDWETVIPEDPKRMLDSVAPVHGDKLIVSYLEDVKTTVYVHDYKTGRMLYQIPLDIGAISGFYARKDCSKVFFSFESFLVPTIVYHADFAKTDGGPVVVEEIRRVKIEGINVDEFNAKQVFYPSRDGTKIPMFIVHHTRIALDGTNPTILDGYGGFNIARLPSFSISRLLFMKNMGGVSAIANLRGGSEYGESWHEAGMLERKQNVFDDFIAAGEFLVKEKYTSPQRLSIQGGSNGGLLVAACSQQRPELFGAVVNRVGVLDMLRFHKFTIGSAWIPEYGDPKNADHFKFLYKYSPLHNLKIPAGGQFPATLLMSADHDDRVVPSHTLKYTAQLYHVVRSTAADRQRNPLIARIEVKAGHGAGKPTSKVIAEIVDIYCFLQRVLNIQWRDD